MPARIFRSFVNQFQALTDAFSVAIHQFLTNGSGPPAAALAVAAGATYRPPVLPPAAQPDSLWDGLLRAVPKHRRTIERRMMRKFGAENWPNGRKLIKPRSDILFCLTCGGHRLAGMLCMTCYKQAMTETREMQEAVTTELGLQPRDREVALVYRGEREAVEDQQAAAVRLVEMPKERPQWFGKNLIQKVAPLPPAETTPVKPSDLG